VDGVAESAGDGLLRAHALVQSAHLHAIHEHATGTRQHNKEEARALARVSVVKMVSSAREIQSHEDAVWLTRAVAGPRIRAGTLHSRCTVERAGEAVAQCPLLPASHQSARRT
jgi:hypothetical protein